MPCYDPRDAIESREAIEFTRKFGPLMCEAVELLRLAGLLPKASRVLQEWAAAHAARDKRDGR